MKLVAHIAARARAAMCAFVLFGWMLANPHDMETGDIPTALYVVVVLAGSLFVTGLVMVVRHHNRTHRASK